MTNEEAIAVIENEIQIDVQLCTDKQVDRFQTALYMAISALRSADHFPDTTKMAPLTLKKLREKWEPCELCESCTNCWFCMNSKTEKPCVDCDEYSKFSPVSYCRYCGRPLTQEACEILEKCIRG